MVKGKHPPGVSAVVLPNSPRAALKEPPKGKAGSKSKRKQLAQTG